MNTVLIVDDDRKLTALLKTYFEKDGFKTYLAYDGRTAIQELKDKQPDIVILDLMLPELDGWEVCRQVRRELNTPILMLTARDEENDRLTGLEIGADDYVTKPFSPREVVARAKAILRRTSQAPFPSALIKVGDLEISLERHEIRKNGVLLELTPTEFKIAELLSGSPGRVFSRLQIVEQVQGYAFDGYERTVDAHIKNLRRKLEKNPKEPLYIQTVYGVGYKFTGESHA